jgi:pyridoxal phosphate enzyme (YggS family)
MERMASVADNLARVHERIAAAATRAGRTPKDVQLIAVTKYVNAAVARQLYEAGCQDLGEARPQELLAKAEALAGSPIRWHLIGHLQRNKAKKLLPHAHLIHSGDSLRLLEELDRLASEQQRTVDVLLEVNISGDASKHGFRPDDVAAALSPIAAFQHLRVRGLMAMSGLEASPGEAAAQFEQVRDLREKLRPLAPPNVTLDELSMGMTDDLEAAIAAGATMVRVGSALFEGLR